jgi:cyclopropane fatty-acyl-phospholipid synthase-like methyltransferase
MRLNAVKPARIQEVEAYYDSYTEKYVQCYGRIIQAARPKSDTEFLDYLVESIGIDDGMRLLDAGCGVCGPSIYFAQKKQVTISAITISAEQVRMSIANISEAGLEQRIEVRKGDFHRLSRDFPEETFDTVLFLETLGYAQRLRQAITETSKVLKPNGHLYVKDFFPVPLRHKVQRNRQLLIVREIRKEYQYKLLDLVSLLKIARNCGFHLTYLKQLGVPEDFTNAATFELDGGHSSYTKAITTPYQLFEILELKFRKT